MCGTRQAGIATRLFVSRVCNHRTTVDITASHASSFCRKQGAFHSKHSKFQKCVQIQSLSSGYCRFQRVKLCFGLKMPIICIGSIRNIFSRAMSTLPEGGRIRQVVGIVSRIPMKSGPTRLSFQNEKPWQLSGFGTTRQASYFVSAKARFGNARFAYLLGLGLSPILVLAYFKQRTPTEAHAYVQPADPIEHAPTSAQTQTAADPPAAKGPLRHAAALLNWSAARLRTLRLLLGWCVRAVRHALVFGPLALAALPAAFAGRCPADWWWRWALAALASSGPAAVKFAQWAATRRDIFPDEMCARLSTLQSDAPTHPADRTLAAIEAAFGPAGALAGGGALRIDPRPIGSGCIAQVPPASCPSGPEPPAPAPGPVTARGPGRPAEGARRPVRLVARGFRARRHSGGPRGTSAGSRRSGGDSGGGGGGGAGAPGRAGAARAAPGGRGGEGAAPRRGGPGARPGGIRPGPESRGAGLRGREGRLRCGRVRVLRSLPCVFVCARARCQTRRARISGWRAVGAVGRGEVVGGCGGLVRVLFAWFAFVSHVCVCVCARARARA